MKKRFGKTIVLFATAVWVTFSGNVGAEEVTKTFKTVKDTFITQEKQDAPGSRIHRGYGACKYLSLDTQHNGEKSNILLEFDLSEIPKNATLLSAFLVMGPQIKPAVGSFNEVEIRLLLKSDWIEGDQGDATHKERTAASWVASSYEGENMKAWETPGALGATDSDAGSKILVGPDKFQDFGANGVNIVDLVRAWNKNREIQFGLLLRTTTDKINYLRWESSNAGDGKGPKLVVTYSL